MQKIKERLFGIVVLAALGIIFIPMFLPQPTKKLNLTELQMKTPAIDKTFEIIQEPSNLVVLNQLENTNTFDIVEQPIADQQDSHNSIEMAEKALSVANQEAREVMAAMTSLNASTASSNTQISVSKKKAQEDLTAPSTAMLTKEDIKENEILAIPSDLVTGKNAWIIQLATFKSQENATKLVDKLKKDGLPAYTKQFENSKGATYTIVLVGPKIHKEEVSSLQQQLQTKYRLNGIIKRHSTS